MQMDEKPSRIMSTVLNLKNNNTVLVTVFEDTAVEQFSNGKRVGVFGWTEVPALNGKVGAAHDWTKSEAPTFEEQCQVILDAIAAKLNGEVV